MTNSEIQRTTTRLRRFVRRNLQDVKSLGWSISCKKMKTLTVIHFPKLMQGLVKSIPGLFAVLILRAIRPFVVIRITPINASRFGHLALDPEMFLAERTLDVNSRKNRCFDIWYLWHRPFPVSNQYLVNLWKKNLRVWPSSIVGPADALNRLLPGGAAHQPPYRKNIPGVMNHVQGDPYDVFYRVRPTLSIPETDAQDARQKLRELGYDAFSRHVCLVVRDSHHFASMSRVDFSDHNFRNSDIRMYQDASDYLEEQGYFVFRMGIKTEREMLRTSSRIIDYSKSDLRSEEMDLFLLSTCTFCISTGTGPDGVALAFRKPVLYTNLSQINQMGLTFHSRFIPRRFIEKETQMEIPLSRIFSEGLDQVRSGDELDSRGFVQLSNSSEDLRNAAEEMHLRLSGKWTESDASLKLQDLFLSQVPQYLKQGTIRGGICSTFLERYEHWTR